MGDDAARHPSPKQTLDARGLRPRKRYGQNFLVDHRFAERVAGTLPQASFVVEIGAGTGTLTAALAGRARQMIALEIDRDLVDVLQERFAGVANVEVRAGDALEFDFQSELSTTPPPRAICGNLPYYITTPLIERIVESTEVWESAVLMVQREYADRLVAKPGTSDYGSLTAYVGYYCAVEKLFDVGAAGFYPMPGVASAVVRFTPRRDRGAGVRDEKLLLKTIRAAFAQRRKTLANCIAARTQPGTTRSAIDDAIRAAGLDPGIRGERLSLDDFCRLANALADSGIAFL
jgi:16S rRNA (adenine1518-N6/adenine1519-N6)-dimethyltransferase